jgi:hypothetical protein
MVKLETRVATTMLPAVLVSVKSDAGSQDVKNQVIFEGSRKLRNIPPYLLSLPIIKMIKLKKRQRKVESQ